jgi:FkbM family methyltransferase
LSVLPFRWKHHQTFLPFYRDDLPHKVLPQASAIRRAYGLWTDDASRREFVAQVQWRLTGNYDDLTPVAGRDAYFDEDLFTLKPDEVVVDCGAYDGDTLRSFLRCRGAAFARYLALEPDPASFTKLKNFADSLPNEIRQKIHVFPYAAGAHPGRVRFAADGSYASAISSQGDIEVELITMDALSPDTPPSFVKMDIEGAEPDALHGARALIAAGKTSFAACVYHAQDHLWSIPLLINDLKGEFRYYLRPYMPEGWELVCYAVPADR